MSYGSEAVQISRKKTNFLLIEIQHLSVFGEGDINRGKYILKGNKILIQTNYSLPDFIANELTIQKDKIIFNKDKKIHNNFLQQYFEIKMNKLINKFPPHPQHSTKERSEVNEFFRMDMDWFRSLRRG